ncbi:MAG: putative GIY-YIG superfamily endonuclease, partial [Saprospiraceae bacterium]
DFITYILFSKSLGKFYTGFTAMLLTERHRRHQNIHKGFTVSPTLLHHTKNNEQRLFPLFDYL